jgi:hypothetical protein
MYWFHFLQNYCYYIIMMCTFEICSLFQQIFLHSIAPRKWVKVRSACFSFLVITLFLLRGVALLPIHDNISKFTSWTNVKLDNPMNNIL